ncbi:MAG: hypothetical protein RJA70_1915, partial [Pseudomonadota bacterium]
MNKLSISLVAVLASSAGCAGSAKEGSTSAPKEDTPDSGKPGDSPGSSGGSGGGHDETPSGGQPSVDPPKPEDIQPPKAGDLKYAPCDRTNKLGRFTVELAEKFTSVQGQVLSGVVEANVPEIVSQDKECRVLKGRALFCDPGCIGGETCGANGKCTPHPENISVGVVTVYGMKDPIVI